jgi:hypothetical protein
VVQTRAAGLSWYNIPKQEKIQQLTMEYIYQMATKYTKWPQKRPTSTIARPSKIYPNCFFFENMPSGNSDADGCGFSFYAGSLAAGIGPLQV